MKNHMLKMFMLLAVLALPGMAWALNGLDITSSASYTIGAQVIKPSNNVTIRVNSVSTAYAVESAHTKGDRLFGTNSVESKIYWKDTGGVGAAGSMDDITSTQVFTGAGWSPM